MQAIARCIPHLEATSLLELKEILHVQGEILFPGAILFSVETQQDIASFCYQTRSSLFVYELYYQLTFTSFSDLKKKLEALEFSSLQESFVVRCERTGEHDFKSQAIEKLLGELIHKKYNLKVDLTNPSYTLLVDIQDNHCLIGLDYAGFKLNKREYRVKTHPHSLNPCLAYSLIRFSEWTPKETLLDPFCGSGEIVIEVALFSLNVPGGIHFEDKFLFNRFLKFSFSSKLKEKNLHIHCTDALHINVRNSEINAKLADVTKSIDFSRIEVDWLDTKFEKESIDYIISCPPFPSRTLPEKRASSLYKELFYQANFILTKKGRLALLVKDPKPFLEFAKTYSFSLNKEISFLYGTEKRYILIFKKT